MKRIKVILFLFLILLCNQAQASFSEWLLAFFSSNRTATTTTKKSAGLKRGLLPGKRHVITRSSRRCVLPAVGLVNSGAMCYQNATLQAMHKCLPLRNALISTIEHNLTLSSSSAVVGLYDVLTQLNSDNPFTYNPSFFATQVCTDFFEKNFGQQDAQEFLVRIWNHLQEENILPNTTAAQDVALDPQLPSWAGVEIRKKLQCFSCKQTRYTPIERSFIIPLAITRARRIESLLRNFTAATMLKGDEQVFCETCNVHTNHKEAGYFKIAPEMNFLVLHMKRFHFWPEAYKVENPVQFPPSGTIKIVDSSGQQHLFEVVSVVVHSGNIHGGHYFCLSKQGIYNDTRVTLDDGAAFAKLLKEGAYEFSQGYLYFLRRIHPGQ